MKSDHKRNKKGFTAFGLRLDKLMEDNKESYVDVYELLHPEMKNYEPDDVKAYKNNALRRIRGRMTGKIETTLSELEKLADYFGVSIDYLVDRNDAETGLSAEAIHSLKSVPVETKKSFSALLENRECVKEIAETAFVLQVSDIIYASYEESNKTDPPEYIERHNNHMERVYNQADAVIFRAVTALSNALRNLRPLEGKNLYQEDEE